MSFIVLAVKSVWQNHAPAWEVLRLLDVFRRMVNDSIRIGLVNDASSLRRLSLLSYNQLARYDSPSCYKLCAISRAAGILAARNKSVRRGFPTRTPYAVRPQLVSCYGFKIENGRIDIPVSRGKRFSIPLTKHVLEIISQPRVKVRSFTLTQNRLSLCIARDTPMIECASTVGVDRNLRNLTVGNEHETSKYDLSKCVRIANTTARIVASFTRNDDRITTAIASRYGQRRTARTGHLLHTATKTIVAVAVQRKTAIVLENIEGIRSLYRKGNGQGRRYRGRMNGWSFGEAQQQIEYKARWVGLPVIRLSRRETRGSSVSCPRCGERLQSDKRLGRKLWCGKCRVVMDRDMVAAVNLARRGRVRFARSRPPIIEAQGRAVEAMKGNPTPTVIPRVDAPKLTHPTKS
ncbi:IS200/IS605 family element transposase accessory protein TnpB [Candidatus Bathyarchaeota archaeon]|nr:MAG: IS200/IS605 family element transposase accessory protein TnpB [Candidatus Bathyarchaeota archaeon]